MYKFRPSWKGLYTGMLGSWIATPPKRQEERLYGRLGRKWASKRSTRRVDTGAGNAPVKVRSWDDVQDLNVLAMRFLGSRRRKAG